MGNGLDQVGSTHAKLRHHGDSCFIACTTAMLEVQSPLLEKETWLGYRKFLANEPEPMGTMRGGGEQCFDMAWCHYAMNNWTGTQATGPMSLVRYTDGATPLSITDDSVNDAAKGRGCVVLYQTPIVHITR